MTYFLTSSILSMLLPSLSKMNAALEDQSASDEGEAILGLNYPEYVVPKSIPTTIRFGTESIAMMKTSCKEIEW